MIDQAKQAIDGERAAAVAELKAEVAKLSLEIAETAGAQGARRTMGSASAHRPHGVGLKTELIPWLLQLSSPPLRQGPVFRSVRSKDAVDAVEQRHAQAWWRPMKRRTASCPPFWAARWCGRRRRRAIVRAVFAARTSSDRCTSWRCWRRKGRAGLDWRTWLQGIS